MWAIQIFQSKNQLAFQHGAVMTLLFGKFVSADYAKTPINFGKYKLTILIFHFPVVDSITPTGANQTPAFFRGPSVAVHIQKKGIRLKHPEWPW